MRPQRRREVPASCCTSVCGSSLLPQQRRNERATLFMLGFTTEASVHTWTVRQEKAVVVQRSKDNTSLWALWMSRGLAPLSSPPALLASPHHSSAISLALSATAVFSNNRHPQTGGGGRSVLRDKVVMSAVQKLFGAVCHAFSGISPSAPPDDGDDDLTDRRSSPDEPFFTRRGLSFFASQQLMDGTTLLPHHRQWMYTTAYAEGNSDVIIHHCVDRYSQPAVVHFFRRFADLLNEVDDLLAMQQVVPAAVRIVLPRLLGGGRGAWVSLDTLNSPCGQQSR